MEVDEYGFDLKTVQALQRRHEGLERELEPLQEKVNRVNLLANSVKASYPKETDNVNNKQKELLHLWEKVKSKSSDKRKRLEEAVGQQIFINSAKALLGWCSGVKQTLNAEATASDPATAELLITQHEELRADITAHNDE